jgi:hypothetical protein
MFSSYSTVASASVRTNCLQAAPRRCAGWQRSFRLTKTVPKSNLSRSFPTWLFGGFFFDSALATTFKGWQEVPGEGRTLVADSAAVYQGKLFLFGVGVADRTHYVNVLDGPTWSGWRSIPGGGTTMLPDSVAVFNDKLYLFGIGIANHAHYVNVLDGSIWSGWRLIPGGGTTAQPDAAVTFRDKLYLFAIGIGDHAHYVNTFNGASWSGWSQVPGGGTTLLADTATAYRDKLYLFGIGTNNHAHYVNIFDGFRWAGWSPVPGGGTTALSDAATVSADKLYLFAIGIGDHAHYVNTFNGSEWSGWHLVEGGGTTAFADAATSYNDNVYLFGIGIGDRKHYVNIAPPNPAPRRIQEVLGVAPAANDPAVKGDWFHQLQLPASARPAGGDGAPMVNKYIRWSRDELSLVPSAPHEVVLALSEETIVVAQVLTYGSVGPVEVTILVDGVPVVTGRTLAFDSDRSETSAVTALSGAGRSTVRVVNRSGVPIKAFLIIGRLPRSRAGGYQ